ncbi:hypothetical protein KUCAC02_001355, partial [Chaenocephalus aceratus]
QMCGGAGDVFISDISPNLLCSEVSVDLQAISPSSKRLSNKAVGCLKRLLTSPDTPKGQVEVELSERICQAFTHRQQRHGCTVSLKSALSQKHTDEGTYGMS